MHKIILFFCFVLFSNLSTASLDVDKFENNELILFIEDQYSDEICPLVDNDLIGSIDEIQDYVEGLDKELCLSCNDQDIDASIPDLPIEPESISLVDQDLQDESEYVDPAIAQGDQELFEDLQLYLPYQIEDFCDVAQESKVDTIENIDEITKEDEELFMQDQEFQETFESLEQQIDDFIEESIFLLEVDMIKIISNEDDVSELSDEVALHDEFESTMQTRLLEELTIITAADAIIDENVIEAQELDVNHQLLDLELDNQDDCKTDKKKKKKKAKKIKVKKIKSSNRKK